MPKSLNPLLLFPDKKKSYKFLRIKKISVSLLRRFLFTRFPAQNDLRENKHLIFQRISRMKITVEPVLFLYLFATMQILATIQEILALKSCLYYESLEEWLEIL